MAAAEGFGHDDDGSSGGEPRQPLQALPSHGSFAAQLPPRPSELLKVPCSDH
jgi:hypothetical protein